MQYKPLPFNLFPSKILLTISKPFIGIGRIISAGFPFLEIDLMQSELGYNIRQYSAIMCFQFLFYFILFSLLVFFIGIRVNAPYLYIISPTIGASLSLLIIFQLLFYPKILVNRKVRETEANLGFALRAILIQTKSGVNLYDALSTVARGKFGKVSEEFKKAVDQISAGIPEDIALQKLAERNPSWYFRRSIWQIVNGLKIGSDVSDILREIVDTLSRDEAVQIRTYGHSLRFLSLIYMLLGVIIPSLGVTFLIILSSFPQIQITESFYWILLVALVVGQFMFLGYMKSKRPTLVGV